ncbi:hypothetical protein COO60DRAFT_164271 [Scenedesmus sp. NREL 46B-D3]|nr:hypothetical protein COO60DRAFT_164271 [Scenedesmus sp. NREL 46B-D3]
MIRLSPSVRDSSLLPQMWRSLVSVSPWPLPRLGRLWILHLACAVKRGTSWRLNFNIPCTLASRQVCDVACVVLHTPLSGCCELMHLTSVCGFYSCCSCKLFNWKLKSLVRVFCRECGGGHGNASRADVRGASAWCRSCRAIRLSSTTWKLVGRLPAAPYAVGSAQLIKAWLMTSTPFPTHDMAVCFCASGFVSVAQVWR